MNMTSAHTVYHYGAITRLDLFNKLLLFYYNSDSSSSSSIENLSCISAYYSGLSIR